MRRDVVMFRGNPFADAEPVPLREGLAAALEAVRLAWEADPGALALLVALQAGTVGAEIAQLVASREAVDAVVGPKGRRSPAVRLLVVGGLGLLAVAGKSVNGALSATVNQAAQRRAEGHILDVVAALELADVEEPAFQDRLQRAFMGAHSQSTLVGSAIALPQGVAGLAGSLAAMSASDRALVTLAIAASVPRWLILRRAKDPMSAMRQRSRHGRESAVIRHYLTGSSAAHELRVFGATPFLRERHDRLVRENNEAQLKLSRENARRNLLAALSGRLADAPAAARLALRVTRKQTSVAEAVTGGLATRTLAGGLNRMVETVNSVCRTAAMVSDVNDFLNEMPAASTGMGPARDFARITVEDLCFTYPGRDQPVLDGVSLEVGRGEVLARVGENGSGKTTLAKLLCSLYEPGKGTIRWDGVDTAGCDPAAVRANIAIVFQDFVRYPSLTAAENIGIGLPARMGDRAAIVEAATSAGAHLAIEALPKGYDTVLSRQFGGVDLSTGQWQRVALARAFLRDAPLVVLDEPTAALDPRAERDLFETVAALYRSRAAVLISHRLSSVRFADRICVLAGGRITETGTHEELVALGGAYAELFELQARAYR
jgi:ATP-binding cassette subfamily B protein